MGSGLYTMLAYVIIGVFIAGLMIGRTPEYLGKKIEALEMRGSIVVVLASGLLVLIFSGIALVISAGTSSIANPGPHGLTEIVYAFASMSNNNGSAFAGLERQHAVLQPDGRVLHVRRPVRPGDRCAGHGRLPGGQEALPDHIGHPAHS